MLFYHGYWFLFVDAQKFKEAFESSQSAIRDNHDHDKLASGLEKLSVNEENGCASENDDNRGGGEEDNNEAPENKSASPLNENNANDSKVDPATGIKQDENMSNNDTTTVTS